MGTEYFFFYHSSHNLSETRASPDILHTGLKALHASLHTCRAEAVSDSLNYILSISVRDCYLYKKKMFPVIIFKLFEPSDYQYFFSSLTNTINNQREIFASGFRVMLSIMVLSQNLTITIPSQLHFSTQDNNSFKRSPCSLCTCDFIVSATGTGYLTLISKNTRLLISFRDASTEWQAKLEMFTLLSDLIADTDQE